MGISIAPFHRGRGGRSSATTERHLDAASGQLRDGPAGRLARKSFSHGRDRLSPEGPERSGGPAKRVDCRARPCAEVNAIPSVARAFIGRSDRPFNARISPLLALLELLVLIYLYVV